MYLLLAFSLSPIRHRPLSNYIMMPEPPRYDITASVSQERGKVYSHLFINL